MPKQSFRLPEFQFPEKGWDAAPLSNAIADYTKSRENQYQFDTTNALNQERIGLEREKMGIARQKSSQEDEARQAQVLAGIAQTIDAEQDQPRRAAMWKQLVGSHPAFPKLLSQYGQDPADHVAGPKFLIAQAAGYQDPQKQELVKAQTETQRAYAESATALRDERRQAILTRQNEQIQAQTQPQFQLNDKGELSYAGGLQPAAMRFPGGKPPPGTFDEPVRTQMPGTVVEPRRATREQQRQETVKELEPVIKGERIPSEAEIQRYWSATYGQKPPSGQKYGRDGSLINMKGAEDKTRVSILGALKSSQGNIDDVREALRNTNMVTRGLSQATSIGTFARSMGPLRISIRGILHGISGAQINIPEQKEYFETMMPSYGDAQSTVEFKLNHLENTLTNIRAMIEKGVGDDVLLAVRNDMRKGLGLQPIGPGDMKKRLDSRAPAKDGWSIRRLD